MSTTIDHVQRARATGDGERAGRRAAMAVLADAKVDEIERGLQSMLDPLDYVELRVPETGLVMLRGRIGGAARRSISAKRR